MNLFQYIREDIQSVSSRDPAAESKTMVLLCYPGLHAVWSYRVHHALWCRGLHLLARMISQGARLRTGVEIHPAARIGRRLFIDHGMGVVIGETAIVGDDVTLYQGVTLGGTGKGTGKRHPTLRDGVFVGSGARILGDIIIGENSRVGAGSVVLRDVPPDSTVVGVPAHLVYEGGKRVLIANREAANDPVSDVVVALAETVHQLRARIDQLDGQAQQAEQLQPASGLTAEKEESAQYRSQQLARSDYLSMGEGI